MLKTVEDSGSFSGKIEASDDAEGIPVKNEENKDTIKKKIHKVRFAKNNEHITKRRYSPLTDFKISSGNNVRAKLPSILKATKFNNIRDTKQESELNSSFARSAGRISNLSNKNLSAIESPMKKSKRGRKSKLEKELASVDSKERATSNSEKLSSLDEKSKSSISKNDNSTDISNVTLAARNTRSKSRRSRDSNSEFESDLPDNDSNDDESSSGEDSPLEDSVVLKKENRRSLETVEEKVRASKSPSRGRGRPRSIGKSPTIKKEEGSLNTPSKAIRPKDDLNVSEKKVDNVKCAKCEEEMPKNKWQSHNLYEHNNMGWQESDPALDFDKDQKLLHRILVAAHKKKRGILNCEKCGTPKKSVAGFISHIQFCGKSSEERNALLVTCPICNRTMMPSSLEVHHRVHKQTSTDSADLSNTESSASKEVVIGSKRKAAERAITKISEFTALVREDEGPPSKKSRSSSLEIKKMIQKPQLKKTIPGVLRTLWKKEISNIGMASCRQPGCEEKYKDIDEVYKHYSMCNFTPRKTFTCKVCKFGSENEQDVINHIAEKHTSELTSNNGSNSDDSTDENENDYEEDDDMSGSEKSRKKHEPTNHVSHHWKKKPKSWYKIEFLAKEGTQNLNRPYLPSVKWTLEFELNNYKLNLFSDLLPNAFQSLDNDEVESYLPELEVSMATKKIDMKERNEEIESSSIEWKRWNRFEGDVEDGTPTFFVGGPVWALSWLPIPVPMFSHNVDQFLAISTHPKMETECPLGRSYVEKNIIQIWNVGKLSNKDGQVDGIPKLAYAIAHTSGTIWCMEWCPSGCYQDKTLSNSFQKNDQRTKMRRMGLLAAACSDGCVHVYSAPFPEELDNFNQSDKKGRIFKTEPVLTLVVNTLLHEKGKQNWQCTKLNWTKENGHDTIVAGFSNGYVALWDLKTKSKLLLKSQGNTIFINAVQHFFAHGHSVSAVSLVPYGGKRYLSTAGLDRCYKFWDLENTNGPQTVLKRGVVVDGAWFTHWPAAINSYDDVLGLNHTSTNLIALREYGYKICLGLATNSLVYTVSVSDYGNAIAHGSLAGEVQTAFANQLLIGMDVDRSVAKKRRLNSLIRIVDFSEKKLSNEEKFTNNNLKGKKQSQKNSNDYKYMPDKYEQCKNRYGLIFYDMTSEQKETIPKDLEKKVLQTDQLSMVPVESYPFTSVNKISWNPNAWSYLWLAAGYQCGIIRITCSKSMYIPSTINQLLPKHVERLIAE